jgi:catechol 2,3-dioxygenase-like lactoylglutathione lyase family enzyme
VSSALEDLAMMTYICFGTNALIRASRFYDATLGALGHKRYPPSDESDPNIWAGWGPAEPSFWLCKPFDGGPATAGNGSMVAFEAKSWKQVDAFHSAALAQGGTSEGPPALRLQYGPDFYAAYVRDPDGNKVAAICRGFTQPQ